MFRYSAPTMVGPHLPLTGPTLALPRYTVTSSTTVYCNVIQSYKRTHLSEPNDYEAHKAHDRGGDKGTVKEEQGVGES